MAISGGRSGVDSRWSAITRLSAVVVAATWAGYALTGAGPAAAAPAAVVDWSEPGATNGLTASDAIAASMLARLRGEAVEDLSQRTESSQTFALPDGQWRADISTGPGSDLL